jgi:hypothetical protein
VVHKAQSEPHSLCTLSVCLPPLCRAPPQAVAASEGQPPALVPASCIIWHWTIELTAAVQSEKLVARQAVDQPGKRASMSP